MSRSVDAAQRRLNIIYAVWYQIAHHGLETVTVRQVAAQAGVSVGQVQHYFPTKDGLISGACQAMVQMAEAQYRQDAEPEPRAAALRLLTQGLPHSESSRVAFAVWHSFAARSFADAAIAALIRETKAGFRRELAALLLEARPELGADAATDGARTLQALADGLGLAVFAEDGELAQAERTLRRALDDLLAG